MSFGGLFIGTIFHEVWHIIAFDKVEKVCYEVGTGAVFSVTGWGWNSEPIGYLITLICTALALWFAVVEVKDEI